MTRRAGTLLLGALLLLSPVRAGVAQGYRLRLDSRMQSVSWRGIAAGAISREDAIAQPNGGFLTPDGHAAICGPALCTFFAPGPSLRGVPWVTQADLSLWGFGMAGLSLRANARWSTDLGDETQWPGTTPELQLVEGYLEYVRSGVTARAGRQFLTGRLGGYGLDGARASYRHLDLGLEVVGYLGWGLARGSLLPVTDPALNPLDDFQPRDRQIAAGLEAGWNRGWFDGRIEYRREVDPAVDYFVSERAAASVSARPVRSVALSGGAEYDLSFGTVGSADATVTWIGRTHSLTAGIRRYRPFFDLWTIWGAFSPVPYTSYHAAGSFTPLAGLTVRSRGERYRFADSEVFTPGVRVEDRGWRWDWGVTWAPTADLVLEGDYRIEFGPGASSRGLLGGLTWQVRPDLVLGAEAARLRRPLELRFNDAELTTVGIEAEIQPNPRWRVGLRATRHWEQRDRPDASGFDWNQFRLAGRISLLLGTNADRVRLPPAVRPPGS